MAVSDLINLTSLIDDAKCFALIRQHRWPSGVRCPGRDSASVVRDGRDDTRPRRQRYRREGCGARFDDLTGTVLAGHHQPVRVWVLCLYFMGLNLSNRQIARELGLNEDDAHAMTSRSREGLTARVTEEPLAGVVEMDEVYVVAGHEGNPTAVQKKAAPDAGEGSGARGTLEKEKPPVFGMIERGGRVVIRMSPNVQQRTIEPIITRFVAPGSLVNTDEYDIYARPPEWGYPHKTVCHGQGEYARDEDGDGHHEVHVNTMEGVWSLSRSWLRPHRGISQERPPLYLAFFQFVHNARKRGKTLLAALIGTLVA